MRVPFSKMQGTGNDFVVLDETRGPVNGSAGGLTADQVRFLASRHFGIGADQVLVVGPPTRPDVDFSYRIFNADGGEVEQCGNGARCFVKFVRDRGLTRKDTIRVATACGVIEPQLRADGRVTVDMGPPIFDLARVPFDAYGLAPERTPDWQTWPIVPGKHDPHAPFSIAVLSMGNPHAVQRVEQIDSAPVASVGPWLERHPRFPKRVNVGFMQVLSPGAIALRVWERGAGETLSCGTGACAAAVAGIRLGWLEPRVEVHTHGGDLSIEWAGVAAGAQSPVLMTGPALTVFEGTVDLPA